MIFIDSVRLSEQLIIILIIFVFKIFFLVKFHSSEEALSIYKIDKWPLVVGGKKAIYTSMPS